MKAQRFLACWATAGVAAFAGIVIYLHRVQAGYDPVHQFMSELALGRDGHWMLVAFFSLASALLALALRPISHAPLTVLRCALVLASLCFAGAGLFPLGASTDIHVYLIALAFVAVGSAMYVLPSYVARAQAAACRVYSWGLLLVLALSVVAGDAIVPSGIGQRLAAASMLLWIVISAWRDHRA